MSKSFRIITTVLLLTTVLAVSHASAQSSSKTPSLYALDDTPRAPEAGWHAIEDALEEYQITTEPKVVASNPPSILLDIPYSSRLEALRTRFVDYGSEWKSWFGVLRYAGLRDEGTGFVYLGYHGDRVTGILHFRGERFQITGGVGGPQRLVRQSDELARTPNCGLHMGDNVSPVSSATSGGEETNAADGSGTLTSKVKTRLDVIAVYPRAYFPFPTSEITLVDFVEDSIALANESFDNSNINAFYNLRHVGPIVQTQPSDDSLQDALDLLNEQKSEIGTLRTAFGADFVTMFVPFGWTGTNACGVANGPVRRTSDNGLDYVSGVSGLQGSTLGKRTYSANRQSCGFDDLTLGHEMAHNFGMFHDVGLPASGTKLLSADARGHRMTVSQAPKATVMACNCTTPPYPSCGGPGVGAVCNRVTHFSDPNIEYMNVDTGVQNVSENAQMARDRLVTYSGFKPVSSNTPPVASFTISCNSSTRVCTFNASGTTDNGSIKNYIWDFGDGATKTTTSATTNHTYGGSGNSFWVHLLATDTGNQRDLAIGLVSL